MSECFTQMRLAHMGKYVSPDRSGPKADVMSAGPVIATSLEINWTQKCGTIPTEPHTFRYRDGSYADFLFMVKDLTYRHRYTGHPTAYCPNKLAVPIRFSFERMGTVALSYPRCAPEQQPRQRGIGLYQHSRIPDLLQQQVPGVDPQTEQVDVDDHMPQGHHGLAR